MSIEAREFLAKVVPWPQRDDNMPSYVNIHYTVKNEAYAKPAWRGTPCQSVDEAIRAVDYALKTKDVKDIYVCMSTQATFVEKQGAKGKFKTAVRSQQGAVALKSLFLDLDAKGEDKNSYATVADAVAALGEFLKVTGLPRPSVYVATGGGLHVYWTLARVLLPQEWLPLARALAEATKRHGLKCDTQCTIDSARVLRVPGTYNRKLATPRPVRLAGTRTDFDYSVERIERALEPYKVAVPADTSGVDPILFPRRPPIAGICELAAGIEPSKAPPVSLDSVATECGFIADTLATGGAANTNPLWNLTNLISVFTEGGRADAHRMGCKHPGYSQGNTDEQFDRKVRESQEKGLGWPSCQTISATGAAQCQKCPLFAAQRSPLNFGSRTASTPGPTTLPTTPSTSAGPATAAAPPPSSVGPTPPPATQPIPPPQSDLPSGYVRGTDNVISEIVNRDDGTVDHVPICAYAMVNPRLESNPPRLHFDSVTERNKTTSITIETEIVNGMGMRGALQSQGLMLPHGHKGGEPIGKFMASWIKKLQETRDAIISAPFGWSYAGGKPDGFVFDGRKWSPGGDTPASLADGVLGRHYKPTGELSTWREAAKLITDQGRPDLEVLLASAFAAPLVQFSGQSGALLAAYSTETGVGKTTTLKTAQAVWGNPIFLQGTEDTQNAVMGRLGQLRSLPMYWDEIKTEEDTKKFVKITFQTTKGSEKARMNASAELKEQGSWKTLLVSCTNASLIDYVVNNTPTTPAGLARVFEFEVSPVAKTARGQIVPSNAALITAECDNNYGVAGLRYAQFLGANYQRVAEDLKLLLEEIGNETDTAADERFWNIMICTTLLGARYANELEITMFDLPAMKVFLVDVLGRQRRERKTQSVDMKNSDDVMSILAQFINANLARHTIWTNTIPTGTGTPRKGAHVVDVKRTKPERLDGLVVHIGVDDKLMRFSMTKFNEWLDSKKYPRSAINKAIMHNFNASKCQAKLGAGTVGNAAMQERLWHIDLAGTPLLNFID